MAAQAADVRRRRREGLIILLTAFAVVAFALFETRLPQFSGGSLGTDAVLVLLIDLNLILLALLVFLVGRNIVKLILDRRRRIMGSHLRTRLVVAFVGIALLPATMLFLVAHVFLSNSIEGWFDGQVERALEGSLDVAHAYYEDLAVTSLGFAREAAKELAQDGLLKNDKRARVEDVSRRASQRVPARLHRGLRRRTVDRPLPGTGPHRPRRRRPVVRSGAQGGRAAPNRPPSTPSARPT